MRIDHVADSNRRLFNKKKNDRLYSIVSVCVSVMRNPHTHTHKLLFCCVFVCLWPELLLLLLMNYSISLRENCSSRSDANWNFG